MENVMKKQPEITDETRKIFVDVFCKLYETRPIEKITVKDIVEQAGYHRSTFYQYFQDVYDLQEYIENELIHFVRQGILSNIQNARFRDGFIVLFISMLGEKEELAKLLFCNSYNSHPINRMKSELVPGFMALFNIPADNIRARYALEFYVPGVLSLIGKWLQNKKDMTLEELANLLKSIIEEGIGKQLGI